MIKVQPPIVQESMVASQKQGQELGQKVMQKIKDESIQPPPNDVVPNE